MAKFKLQAGAELDLLTQGEVTEALNDAQAREDSRLQGVKPIRFQLQGVPAGGAITLGDPSTGNQGGIIAGPEQGYVQNVSHLAIEGLTTGATPDVINVFRNSRIVWQLNGNQFAQTWGKGQMLLNPGEVLYFKSSGTFAATGTIVVHGTVWNVPAELVGKLY